MAATALATGEDRRGLALAGAGVEVHEGDGNKRFSGHAAVFNQRAAIGNPLKWGFYEEIAPGSFSRTLTQSDVRKLIDHDSYYVVSRMSAGTLTLSEDAAGLHVDSALDTDLSYVSDLVVNLRNGNITGMSFGFYVLNDDWWTEAVTTNDGMQAEVEVRRITEIKLIEVSSVTFPAFPQTDAGLRAADGTPRVRMRPEDEVRAVGVALARRPDGNALLEARAQFRPELNDYRSREVVHILDHAGNIVREDEHTPDPSPSEPADPGETTPPPADDEGFTEQPADDGAPVADAPSSTTPDEDSARSTPRHLGTELRRRILNARRPAGLPA